MPKFMPIKPFSLHQQNSHFGNLSKNSIFISDLIRRHIEMGGVFCSIYRLKGTFPQDADALGIRTDNKKSNEPIEESGQEGVDISSFLGVQDTILGENRDREYDFDEIPIVKGVYSVSQNELEYARFGMALSNDIITMEFHTRSIEKECNRRFIIGDVVELPHLREVGVDGRVANKWYEIKSIVYSPTGYDPMYARHVSAVILRPLRHQQEFLDIFERTDEYGRTLADQASNLNAMMSITEKNQELANEHAYTTWWDTTLMWFDPDHPSRMPYRWTEDGKPDNGAPVGQGSSFPVNPSPGDWFIRTDLVPNKLYRYQNGKWMIRKSDLKREWQPYNWVVKLQTFLDANHEDNSDVKLRSIHDALTDRERRSEPVPTSKVENQRPDESPALNKKGRTNPYGSGK